jgi:hypothetical protein
MLSHFAFVSHCLPRRILITVPLAKPEPVPGDSANFAINPMDHSRANRLQNLIQAPRCGARTRSGTPCQRPAIRGRKRCRLHGGLSPGAPRGENNGNYKSGDWTLEAVEERKWLRSLVRSFAGARNEENQGGYDRAMSTSSCEVTEGRRQSVQGLSPRRPG